MKYVARDATIERTAAGWRVTLKDDDQPDATEPTWREAVRRVLAARVIRAEAPR